jgi:F-type H+-transporting ATPase subunit epsilon
MNTFSLHLFDAMHTETIDSVVAFTGSDRSGSFSIWAGHERMITELEFGIAKFRLADGAWQYLALPGALLYFCDNTLKLCARRFVRSADYQHISTLLNEQLRAEEANLHKVRSSLRQMEEAVLKRLFELNVRAP